MTTAHGTFSIERTYDAAPDRVFAAWSSAPAKAAWFVLDGQWTAQPHRLDFRVGGEESVAGGPVEGGTVYRYHARYQDIVPNERIVTTYEMYADDRRLSVSVATVEFLPEGEGTRLVHTELGAFLDGLDENRYREGGTKELLDNLGKVLAAGGPVQ
ncbi:SRPBCC family protein [Actinosynnema sp. NPDC020468]|uniref:SRPBCC family protein n=1 Tax=Actinosynnema sp. NPDC020468 TaxID=3154488 RepID=UPI0033CF4800